MKESHNKIDDLFKSALDDYTKEPSSKILKILNKKMFFKDIIRLNFKNIFTKNVIKYSSFMIIGVSTFFVSTHIYNNNKTKINNTITQTQIEPQTRNNANQSVFAEMDTIDNKSLSALNFNTNEKNNTTKQNVNLVSANDLNNSNLNSKKTELPGKYTTANNISADNSRPKTINNSENKQSNKENFQKEQNNNIDKEKNKKENTVNGLNKNTDLENINKKNINNEQKNNPVSGVNKTDLNSTGFKNKKESITITNPNEVTNNQNKSDSSQDKYDIDDYKNMNYKITILPSKPVTSIINDGELTNSNIILPEDKKKDHFLEELKEPYMIIPKYTLEFYGGGDYVNKILSSPLNSYIDERKNMEKSIFAYNFGADIKYNIKNMFVLTGVNRSVFGENVTITTISHLLDSSASHFDFDYHQIIEIDTVGWTPGDSIHPDSIPILDSVIFNIKDSSWVSVYDSVNKENKDKYKNRVSYFEIPLMVGFSFGKAPFRFNVATGVSFGFLTNVTGKLIKPYTNDVSDFNKSNFPFSAIMYNYMLRAGCNYSINDKWGVFVRAAFKYNLNSIFDKTYPVNQRYYTIGLQGGIFVNL